MKEILEFLEKQEVVAEPVNRRTFLTRAAVAGLGVAALGVGLKEDALAQPRLQNVRSESQFRQAALGLGTLSLMTSQIALNKASNNQVREFATFETAEQIALGNILKDLNTPAPPMTPAQRAILANLRSLSRGAAFDRAYVRAQHDTHLKLRELNEAFLRNSSNSSMAERHSRHISQLALATINEHIVHTQKLRQIVRA